MKNDPFYNPYSRTRLASIYQEYFKTQKWSGFKAERLSVTGRDSQESFINDYHQLLRNFQRLIFSYLMRIEWVDRNIWYNGKNKFSYEPGKTGLFFNSALKFFYEHFVGFTRRFWSDGIFRAIRSYADDFFPDFDSRDGFTSSFDYPYQYISLEALYFVHKMPERLRLLQEGEDGRMGLLQFYDYVAQYMTEKFIQDKKDYKIYWKSSEKSLPYVNENLNFVQRMQRKLERKLS